MVLQDSFIKTWENLTNEGKRDIQRCFEEFFLWVNREKLAQLAAQVYSVIFNIHRLLRVLIASPLMGQYTTATPVDFASCDVIVVPVVSVLSWPAADIVLALDA